MYEVYLDGSKGQTGITYCLWCLGFLDTPLELTFLVILLEVPTFPFWVGSRTGLILLGCIFKRLNVADVGTLAFCHSLHLSNHSSPPNYSLH